MSDPWLLLWLEGPLQAWGHDSKFGRRDTLAFPTKSGVLGMVCSALGAGGEQRELLNEFAGLPQTVIAYARCRQQNGETIKQDREPLLRDFQMVGSGYDDGDPWASLLIPKKSDGGKAVGGGTKMTYRYYLQDACFAVLLQVPAERVAAIAEALQSPTWDVYLGRKHCAPTDFIFRGCFTRAEEAMAQAQSLASEKQRLEDYRVLDGEHEGEVLTLMDVPIQFGERKRYRDRRVTVVAA
ncbi:type I-E CRISPR-associated protein Cas5/CasD [Methylomonas albis]|uniref:Type I-E CRISPR-associated protein Cas5/CasD n=1 Tax=Methylomonas albis TaxID=1854563 RepID=A0ABR9D4W7_9GAMM|nr:type I-E CRISPR-associated protein Cas5/CasD [Methylomonas albis]MBD9357836.1 type I-E CRISPR-associated protein Cas5/CasD [Methylomonas albis]